MAEMVRRSKIVNFVRRQTENYEMMVKSKADKQWLDAVSFMIERLCEEFGIENDELQVTK